MPILIEKDNTLPLAGRTDCDYFIRGYRRLFDGFPYKLTDDTPKPCGIELPPQWGNFSRRIVGPFLLRKRHRVTLEVGNQDVATRRTRINGKNVFI
jgi:hypothetical protein